MPKYHEVEFDRERWPSFRLKELACFEGNWPDRKPCRFCGGEYYHAPNFLDNLQALRNEIDRPVFINSAHRCRRSDLRVGGVGGPHRAIAVDILLFNQDRFKLLLAAKKYGFTGTGFYISFLHLDRGRNRNWYGSGAKDAWRVT